MFIDRRHRTRSNQKKKKNCDAKRNQLDTFGMKFLAVDDAEVN